MFRILPVAEMAKANGNGGHQGKGRPVKTIQKTGDLLRRSEGKGKGRVGNASGGLFSLIDGMSVVLCRDLLCSADNQKQNQSLALYKWISLLRCATKCGQLLTSDPFTRDLGVPECDPVGQVSSSSAVPGIC